MIKVIKFMEKAWLVISIATFIIAIYWSIKSSVFDALYFYGFSVIAITLFYMRRKQRMYHEREAEKNKK